MSINLASKRVASDDRRKDRYAARHVQWTESALPRVQNCGRAVQSNGVDVLIKVSADEAGRHAGVGNVQHCGSVWACPVCSATISATRQSDIERALTAWHAGAGTASGQWGKVAMVTLTMRHNKFHSLKRLWSALGASWHAVASGDGWTTDQAGSGVLVPGTVYKSGPREGQVRAAKVRIPIIRVVEVTQGVNGWHVHVHALLLLPNTATDESVQALGARMYGRWVDSLRARGLDASERRGVDVRLFKGDPSAALGEYFTKSVYSASMEVARSDMKSARHGGRTPFGILAAVVKVGDADDLDLWHEFELAAKGRRQIAWSAGLRALLLPVAEVVEETDQELVDAEAGGDVVAEVPGDVWRLIVARRSDYKVLRAFERSNVNGWRLLWLYADAAGSEAAAKFADQLAHPDGHRRRYQTKEPA